MLGRTLAAIAATLTFACSSEPVEPAPLKGGETLVYQQESMNYTFSFDKTEKGYTIKLNPPAAPPQEVGLNLRNGREQVKALAISLLWLEPSQRKIGGQTPFGNIVAEEKRMGRDALKMSERNGNVEYWFDKATGFLLVRRQNPSGPTISLMSSTVPGLLNRR